MSDIFRGGDTITDGTVTGVIQVTQFSLGGGVDSVKYGLVNPDGDYGDARDWIAHKDATRLAFGRHSYEPHKTRKCGVCGIAKKTHGSGARSVAEAPGPPRTTNVVSGPPSAKQPLTNVGSPGEVTSSFQNRPAYHYIRKTDGLPTYDQLDEADGHTFDNILCKVKLFNPTGVGTWWLAAYDPDDEIAWGVCELFEREVGTVSMTELVELRGAMGLPIERDIFWTPRTMAQVLAERS